MNSYIFLIDVKYINLKQEILKKNAASLCSGNVSRYLSVDKMKKTGLYGYLYGFSADCDSGAVDDILDIHKYLMK